MTIFGKR